MHVYVYMHLFMYMRMEYVENFREQVLGFMVWGSRLQALYTGFMLEGLECTGQGLGFRVCEVGAYPSPDPRAKDRGNTGMTDPTFMFKLVGAHCKVSGLWTWGSTLRSRVLISGF